jgi:16S rRNA (guanine966-N2)-methyltransferase
MRIIAGDLKGHIFSSPHSSHTHPMSDKIRGALFNSMGDISGLRILDAFAGTGAISFEAVSRGAREVIAIDSDRSAFSTIVRNRETLAIKENRLKVIQASCYAWSHNNQDSIFDVVILDPPYEKANANPAQIFSLKDHIATDGLFVVSLPPKTQLRNDEKRALNGLKEVLRKNYGDAELVFYKVIA